MHEALPRGCLLGCREAPDDLARYVGCRTFWRALKTALQGTSSTCPPNFVSSSLVERLTLLELVSNHVLQLCALLYSYHVIKNTYSDSFAAYARSADVSAIARIMVDVLKSAIFRFQARLPISNPSALSDTWGKFVEGSVALR